MKKSIWGLILTLAGALTTATPALASPITIVGGTAGSIPSNPTMAFIPGLFSGPQIGGYFGAQISVNVPVPTNILFEFFGADTVFHNEFDFFGSELFDHAGSPAPIVAPNLGARLGAFTTVIIGSGLLPFTFDINSDATHVNNPGNPDPSSGSPNFFATCNPFSGVPGAGGLSCDSVYLFLEDTGGLTTDHDDFLVRITVASVPEPATLSLLGLGLVGVAARRARAKRN